MARPLAADVHEHSRHQQDVNGQHTLEETCIGVQTLRGAFVLYLEEITVPNGPSVSVRVGRGLVQYIMAQFSSLREVNCAV